MVTQAEVLRGMGLDDIIASDVSANTYGSLRSTVLNDLESSLDPRVPGGISELLDMFNGSAPEDQAVVVDALRDLLNQARENLHAEIQADLDAQAEAIEEQAAIDLASNILPPVAEQLDLLNLVTTPQFKEIVDQHNAIENEIIVDQ